MSERKEKEVKENKLNIDDIKEIFFDSIPDGNLKFLNKSWNGTNKLPIKVKSSVKRNLNLYKNDESLLPILSVNYRSFIYQYNDYINSQLSSDVLWKKEVEPKIQKLLKCKKEELYKGEQLKSYVINILKEVNNDYSKLVKFLIENNYINLENEKVILYIFINPNLNIEVLFQLSRYWIEQDELSGYLNENLGITVKDIKKHPEIKWRYDLLSRNPNMTWEFIKENFNGCLI